MRLPGRRACASLYVPVAADERLPKVISGADRSRMRLDDGQRRTRQDGCVLAGVLPERHQADGPAGRRAAPGWHPYRDLAGRTVVVGAGTTNAEVMQRLASKVSPPDQRSWRRRAWTPPTRCWSAGKADAFASDDILLAGFIATRPRRPRLRHRGRLPVVRAVCDHAAPRRPARSPILSSSLRAHGERGHAEPALYAMAGGSACRPARPSAFP